MHFCWNTRFYVSWNSSSVLHAVLSWHSHTLGWCVCCGITGKKRELIHLFKTMHTDWLHLQFATRAACLGWEAPVDRVQRMLQQKTKPNQPLRSFVIRVQFFHTCDLILHQARQAGIYESCSCSRTSPPVNLRRSTEPAFATFWVTLPGEIEC